MRLTKRKKVCEAVTTADVYYYKQHIFYLIQLFFVKCVLKKLLFVCFAF